MANNEILEYSSILKFEQHGNDAVIKINLPKTAAGGFYKLEMFSEEEIQPPYLISFILHSHFELYMNEVKSCWFKQGFSNLQLKEGFPKGKPINIQYSVKQSKDNTIISGNGNLYIRSNNNRITQFDIEMVESDSKKAVSIANMLITRILDHLCFLKGVPISVREIRLIDKTRKHVIIYKTIPYHSIKTVNRKDLEQTMSIPDKLAPLLALYREGMNSFNQHYRFLTLFRTYKGLTTEVIPENNRKLKSLSVPYKRHRTLLRKTDVTQKYFPKFVNRSYHKFFNFVQKRYRNHEAHYNSNDQGQLLLDPREFKINMILSTVNEVMLLALREAIAVEIKLMEKI